MGSGGVGLTGLFFLGVRKETKDDDADCLGLGLSFCAGVSTGDDSIEDSAPPNALDLAVSKSSASVRASVRFSLRSSPCRRSWRYWSKFSTSWQYHSSCVTSPWNIE